MESCLGPKNPFALSDKGSKDERLVVLNRQVVYKDGAGNIERVCCAPSEAEGLRKMGRLFFNSNYYGYQTLVNMFNKIYGDNFAKIIANPPENSYHVYVSPIGTGGDFFERYMTLENAIALNYHPELTKAKLLTFIHSEEDRKSYLENPSSEKLIEIFSKQLDIDFSDSKKNSVHHP